MFRAKHILIGYFGESLAGLYLSGKGYRIIDRNIRIAGGEIDLICYKKPCLVFVEVKTISVPDEDLLTAVDPTQRVLLGIEPKIRDGEEIGLVGKGVFDGACHEALFNRIKFNPENNMTQRKLSVVKRVAGFLANGRYAKEAAGGWRLDLIAVILPKSAPREVTQDFLSKCLIRHYENIF